MIRIQLINEGKIVKQITSRVHESVMLEQVKQFKDTFDTIQIVEGELSEDAKSVLQHVARKIIPAAMAAGVAMGGANANAQGGANPNYPGMDRSIGQHISDIVSPRYNEIQRQRKYEQETQRKEWDAQQGEIRQGRVDNARTAGRAARGATHYKLYDQSRISKDGKFFVIYGMDDKITRIPTAGTEFMAADSQRLAHYISPAGQVYYVRHPHNNGLGESVLDDVRARMDARRNPAAPATTMPATTAPAAQPAADDSEYKVGDNVDFGVGVPKPKVIQQGTITAIQRLPSRDMVYTVKTADGQTHELDTRMRSLYLQPVTAPAVAEAESGSINLPRATMSKAQNKTTGAYLIQYNGQSFAPADPYTKAPADVTGTRVLVPAAALGIRSMGDVVALLSNDGTAYAEQPIKVVNPFGQAAQSSASRRPAQQGLDEAGEWKAEAEDFKEWSNHVKDALLGVAESQRFAMAKKLSQIEIKHFGASQANGSFNSQTGASTGSTGMTTTVQHIFDAINDGKLTAATTPAATAAIAGGTQQTAFGSVTRPAGQPDPYHASPASQYGDRPAAQAAQNQARPQQGGGSIQILRTEQDWEEALSNQGTDDVPSTAAGLDSAMSKLPTWKVMLATIMLASKLPVIGDKIKNTIISSIQKEFGVTMSFKEALGYMQHVRNTPADQIVSPAVWKFEKDGGDYETAIEQLPDDAVDVRPAEVMSTIANSLISAGVAEEIKPGDDTPGDAGAGAFGNMASQLSNKTESVVEAKGLHKRVRIVKGPDSGKTGYIRQIEHGQYKGAPKKYDVDIEGGGQANGLPATALRLIKAEQGVTEGVAESMPMADAVKVLKHYGADNFKTTSNELHFYKNGQPFSVDLILNDDATRSVTLSSLNSATRGLKGQGVAEGIATIGTVGTIPASGASSMTTKTKFGQTGSTTDVKFNSKGQLELDDDLDADAVDTLKKAGVEVAEATGMSPELSAILDQYADSFEEFKSGGDITDNNDFYEALIDFFSNTNELPYDVATSGDPAEWISNKLNQIGGHQPMGESDDIEAAADQNIIMQIRRAADYEIPVPMRLGDGSTIKIDSQTANKMLAQFDKLKPDSKALMQQTLNTAEGFREMLNYFNEREVQEDMQFIEQISNHMKPITEARLRATNLIKSVFGK